MAVRERLRDAWRRVRRAVKAFCYSGGPRRERWQHPERVLDALPVGRGDRVADLGAGAGYFAIPLARAVGPGGRVYAVDVDPDMPALVARAAAREGLDNVVTVAAGERDPALPEPVDLVLVVDALHHLPDPADYARTLAGYLRPGGRVAIIEPHPRWFLLGHATDRDLIRSLMTAAGYTVTTEHDFLPRQSFLVFERAA